MNDINFAFDNFKWQTRDIFAALVESENIIVAANNDFLNNSFRCKCYPALFYFFHLYEHKDDFDRFEMHRNDFIRKFFSFNDFFDGQLDILAIDYESFSPLSPRDFQDIRDRIVLGVKFTYKKNYNQESFIIMNKLNYDYFYNGDFNYSPYFGRK
jgi:hypothetical protein